MSALLKCKTCNNDISPNAQQCPQCGEVDPFHFKEIRKIGKQKIKYSVLMISQFAVGAALLEFGVIEDLWFWSVHLLIAGLLLLGYTSFISTPKEFTSFFNENVKVIYICGDGQLDKSRLLLWLANFKKSGVPFAMTDDAVEGIVSSNMSDAAQNS